MQETVQRKKLNGNDSSVENIPEDGNFKSVVVNKDQLDNQDLFEENLSQEIVKTLVKKDKYKFDTLKPIQVWGYSVGHFYNDACASIWFNYLLLFLENVKGLNNIAPYSMLGGQIFDAVATPLVGLLSDKTETEMGKRTPWYIGGVIVVTITFLPIFLPLIKVENPPGIGDFIYYITFPCLFNVGWASVQIAQMSLVPSLTCSRKRRDLLNGRRNTFSFAANIFVLVLALFFFQFLDNNYSYPLLAIVTVIVGLCFSLFFLSQIKEVQLVQDCQKITKRLRVLAKQRLLQHLHAEGQKDETESIMSGYRQTLSHHPPQKQSKTAQDLMVTAMTKNDDAEFSEDEGNHDVRTSRAEMNATLKKRLTQGKEEQVKWTKWFKELLFYQCGIIYMGVRLYCNVIATMLQFYIIFVLEFETEEQKEKNQTPIQVALIPLTLFIVSTGASSVIEKMFLKIGRKRTFSIGAVCALLATLGLLLLTPDYKNYIYLIAIFIGLSQALVLNTGITLISEVIGVRGSSGAFVFGSYSFLDKLSTGIVLFVVTNLEVFKNKLSPDHSSYIRYMTSIIPAVACGLAWILVLIQKTKDYDQGSKSSGGEHSNKRNSLEQELAI